MWEAEDVPLGCSMIQFQLYRQVQMSGLERFQESCKDWKGCRGGS